MSKNLGTIKKLMDSFNPYRQRLEETRGLVKKWEATGLLEGIEEEQRVNSMAVLLENQARQLIDEASTTSTTANSEEWSGVALPLVRKIFGELAAQEFVSVQPMNLPSGLVFYLDFKYGTAQAGNSAGQQVFGITSGSGDASQGLYGAGKFGYSVNESSTAAQSLHASSVASGTFTSASVSWADVDFEPDLSASVAIGSMADNGLMKLNVAKAAMTNPDMEGVRAFEISGTGFDAYYPAYTAKNSASDQISFIVKKDTAAVPSNDVVVKYHKQPTDVSRGDFEASAGSGPPETDAGIPEIDIQMRSEAIVAKTRKLKAVWTPELAQDLNAYHSVYA